MGASPWIQKESTDPWLGNNDLCYQKTFARVVQSIEIEKTVYYLQFILEQKLFSLTTYPSHLSINLTLREFDPQSVNNTG